MALVAIAWWTSGAISPTVLLFAATGCVIAALVIAMVVARRRRWADETIGLYLDARLGSRELVTSALSARAASVTTALHESVLTGAHRLLATHAAERAVPRIVHRGHAFAPLFLAAALGVSWLPPRVDPVAPPAAPMVRDADAKSLDSIEKLTKAPAMNAEQRKRLDDIAARAKELRQSLKDGLEQKEALARLAELGDAVRSERSTLGDSKNRPGLEEALRRIEREPALRDAARALGDSHLETLESELTRLADVANEVERRAVAKALEEAQKAAEARGSAEVGSLLRDQRRRFEERVEQSDTVRALAEALGKDAQSPALERWRKTGSTESAKQAAGDLAKALEKLSPEERQELAENLRAAQGNAAPDAPADSGRSTSAQNPDTLAETLRNFAQASPSPTLQREAALDGASRSLDEAQQSISGTGPPSPGAASSEQGAIARGEATGGASRGPGVGSHSGQTRALEGAPDPLKARVEVRPGEGMVSTQDNRRAPTGPQIAGDPGGPLPSPAAAAPGRVQGIDKTRVPGDYREQVARYFSP